MPYCPKCGNKVDEEMVFCPRCGASLRPETGYQAAPGPSTPQAPPMRQEKAEKGEKSEKQEKQQPEKGEKHESSQLGFVGFLVGGVILIMLGVVAYADNMQLWSPSVSRPIVLLAIGAIIIIVGVYVAMVARRRHPQPNVRS